jgi:transcriptional regulator with XRE-family HTH domain
MTSQEEAADQEARRLVELLGRLVKLSGRSLRSLEEELGMGSSVLSKILNGVIRPQLSYVLLIAGALGVSPAQFFQLAYPRKTAVHPLVQKVWEATGEVMEEEQIPADLKEQVREAVLDLLAELRRDKP